MRNLYKYITFALYYIIIVLLYVNK